MLAFPSRPVLLASLAPWIHYERVLADSRAHKAADMQCSPGTTRRSLSFLYPRARLALRRAIASFLGHRPAAQRRIMIPCGCSHRDIGQNQMQRFVAIGRRNRAPMGENKCSNRQMCRNQPCAGLKLRCHAVITQHPEGPRGSRGRRLATSDPGQEAAAWSTHRGAPTDLSQLWPTA